MRRYSNIYTWTAIELTYLVIQYNLQCTHYLVIFLRTFQMISWFCYHQYCILPVTFRCFKYNIYFFHYYSILTPLTQWWKNLSSPRGLKCLVPFPARPSTELCRGPPKDFEIKFVLDNGGSKFSFSCSCGLRYFSTLES